MSLCVSSSEYVWVCDKFIGRFEKVRVGAIIWLLYQQPDWEALIRWLKDLSFLKSNVSGFAMSWDILVIFDPESLQRIIESVGDPIADVHSLGIRDMDRGICGVQRRRERAVRKTWY
jgi:hypothetical protein